MKTSRSRHITMVGNIQQENVLVQKEIDLGFSQKIWNSNEVKKTHNTTKANFFASLLSVYLNPVPGSELQQMLLQSTPDLPALISTHRKTYQVSASLCWRACSWQWTWLAQSQPPAPWSSSDGKFSVSAEQGALGAHSSFITHPQGQLRHVSHCMGWFPEGWSSSHPQ